MMYGVKTTASGDEVVDSPVTKFLKADGTYESAISNPGEIEDMLVHGGENPIERLCQGGAFLASDEYLSSDTSLLLQMWAVARNAAPIFEISSCIVRMYNGVTSDEVKFVGYGLRSPGDVDLSTFFFSDNSYNTAITSELVFVPFDGGPVDFITIKLISYCYEYSDEFSSYDFNYTSISGIPMCCAIAADGFESESVDAENRTATIETGPGVDIHTITIDSLEFYNQ